MPTPQTTTTTSIHPTCSAPSTNDSIPPTKNKNVQSSTLAAATSRPFTTTATTRRPIYGRRSINFDPRLNSRVRNEHRVPNNVSVRVRSRSLENGTVRGKREEEVGLSTLSTKNSLHGDLFVDRDGEHNNDGSALEGCKESLSPDVADYQVNRDNDNDDRDDHVSGTDRRPKPAKRRLSYAKSEQEHENNNQMEHDNTKSTKSKSSKKSSSKKSHRSKAKRRRMKLTNENSRPNKEKDENLSFTESSEHDEHQPNPTHNKSPSSHHHHRRSSTGTKSTTITIRTKSNKNGRIIQSANIQSNLKELRELAKTNNGTATQYRATYHTGPKPIHDKNDTSGHRMIQVGQLIIKETYVTCKGNKGGNSYGFEEWKLPGSRQRDSSIYDSTRPQLVGVNGKLTVRTTCAPQLIVDTALSTLDAERVRRFVVGAKSGQTPMEFVAMMSEEEEDFEGEEGNNDDEVLFSGSIVSEVDEGGREVDAEVERKVLGDKSNTVGHKQIKGEVHDSAEMKLSNKYHKGRTQSARKKRKSAQISPTEPRKKRMVDSIVRFYVPESKSFSSQKFFGLIEGVGGGLDEEGLSNVTPHRGRLLELPGYVLGGQWETRLIKGTVGSNANEQLLRISLRHESSSLRSLEHLLSGKDELADGRFVSVLKPIISRSHQLIQHGVMMKDETEMDDDEVEHICGNVYIACVSIVLFGGFLSSSESIAESRDVASEFLKKCVPSNELQIGRELYGIVGNEYDANDDQNITGMLYPCNVSLESEHTILLLHNEDHEVSGIDVIFRPSIDGLNQYSLTDDMLKGHLDEIGSDENAIMERYIEKNTGRVLERPSPLKFKSASVVSHSDDCTTESEVEVEEVVQSDDESHEHEFGGNDENGFDANADEISSARESKEVIEVQDQEGSGNLGVTEPVDIFTKKDDSSLAEDSKDENEVQRLHEESLTLRQRIENLEEEKRLLAQQIVKQILKKKTAAPTECVVEQSVGDDEATGSLTQNTPPDATLTSSKKPEKKSFTEIFEENDSALVAEHDKLDGVDKATINPEQNEPPNTVHASSKRPKKKSIAEIFGDDDFTLSGERSKLTNVEKDAVAEIPATKKNIVTLKDLFGDEDSLFGVSTKKINRRKSTGDISNTRALIQKQHNGGRHSTGGLMKTHKQTQKEKSRRPTATAPKVLVASSVPKSTVQLEMRQTSMKRSNTERRRPISASRVTCPTSESKSTRRGAGKKTAKKKKASNRRSTYPIKASGINSLSVRKHGTANRKKVNVADLFGDSESMFGCVTKRPSMMKKVMGKSFEPGLDPNNDVLSLNSLGGRSISFESASTQAVCKPSNITTDDGHISHTQPMFDIYFGKDADTSIVSTIDEDNLSMPSVEEQPFFDYYFGQDLSNADDESTKYPMQPLHSVYYGGLYEEQSTLRSVTSSFETPTVPLSLYYFDNDDIVPARLSTSRFPFFDYNFGQVDNDEESSALVWTPQHPPAATDHPSFHDYYFGQEDVVVEQMQQNVATKKTPWRCKLATCLQCLVVGVLPALLPLALLVAKQSSSDDLTQQFDANNVFDIVEETASTWWSLKPWDEKL